MSAVYLFDTRKITMTTQRPGAQIAPAIPPKLNPDFRHRLSILGDEATAHLVSDAVDKLADQAENLLVMIQDQFIAEKDKGRLSDEVIFCSLGVVADLVVDIRVIVQAHHEATMLQDYPGKEGAQ
jgi:hypothetical protein